VVGAVEAVKREARQNQDHRLGEDEEQDEESLPSFRLHSNPVSVTSLVEARHEIGG
jgi:hypothetical protein